MAAIVHGLVIAWPYLWRYELDNATGKSKNDGCF